MKNLLLLLIIGIHFVGFGCTTFILDNQDHYLFGRNLDWNSDHGLVLVNKKGIKKKGFLPTETAKMEWISKFGSVTFNQFGKELPYGGINEKGLVIEIMRSQADYPKKDKRTGINELQWIQYQLDVNSTVDQVIASDSLLRIVGLKEELHFLVADKNGNKAVIEFLEGEMVFYCDENLPLPVLENETYKASLNKKSQGLETRFTKVCQSLKSFEHQKNGVDFCFDVLQEVALDGSWSIVYDINRMEIHFKSNSKTAVKTIKLSELDFNCHNPTMMLNINTKEKGDVHSYFQPYSSEVNKKILEKSIQINNMHKWPAPVLAELLNYAQTCYCVYR